MSLLPKFSKLIMELSRRRVIRAMGIYIVTLWLLAQGVADLFPAFGLPDWSVRAFVLAGLLGVPAVVFLAWRYDLTPHGLIPDPGSPDDDATLAEFPSAGIMTVAWVDMKGEGRKANYHGEFTVGRDAGNRIQLADQRVSRRHVRLFPAQGQWWIEDLASSNGTFLDGEKIQRRELPAHCEVQLHPQGPKLNVDILSADATIIDT